MRIVISIEKQGSLYFLINAFIGAYNRRTDVLERQGDVAVEAAKLSAKLKTSRVKLTEAIQKENPNAESSS